MQRIILIVALMGLHSLNSKAQFQQEQLARFSIGVGYFGELLTHPGLVFFGEYAIAQSQNQLLTRLNVMHYRHKAHTKNWMLTPEIIYRRNTDNMNFFELALGIGCLNQHADSKVLLYTENGFEESTQGWNYFVPSLAIRAGKRLSFKINQISPFVGLRTFCLYPFNNDALWRFAFDFGIDYKLK